MAGSFNQALMQNFGPIQVFAVFANDLFHLFILFIFSANQPKPVYREKHGFQIQSYVGNAEVSQTRVKSNDLDFAHLQNTFTVRTQIEATIAIANQIAKPPQNGIVTSHHDQAMMSHSLDVGARVPLTRRPSASSTAL